MPWTKTTRGSRPQLHSFPGATLEVVRLPGRTPLLFMDVPGDSGDTVLLYGHLDKQPEMKGWSEGLGPWLPVRKDDKLYGRGDADDGYAISPVARHAAMIRARGARGAHGGGQPIGLAPAG
jgi:acetylornithine deacetylase/succinyl-diaminopimelate desuccinylase-like protein